MVIKIRLTVMSFLQFFVWGAWMITIGVYWFQTKHWSGTEFGAIFSTLGISSLIMPALTGIIADKWINVELLYGILHILFGFIFLYIPHIQDPDMFFWVILLAMLCYMPTIALSNSIAYTLLKKHQYDIIKDFPPIRVWGTVGFIAAMWVTDLTHNKASVGQFYIASIAAISLGIYSFFLPPCPPLKSKAENATLSGRLGLNAFKLFRNPKMALFSLFPCFWEVPCN